MTLFYCPKIFEQASLCLYLIFFLILTQLSKRAELLLMNDVVFREQVDLIKIKQDAGTYCTCQSNAFRVLQRVRSLMNWMQKSHLQRHQRRPESAVEICRQLVKCLIRSRLYTESENGMLYCSKPSVTTRSLWMKFSKLAKKMERNAKRH